MSKLTKKKLQEIDDILLQFPTLTNTAIAKKLNLSEPTISNYRKARDIKIDQEFIAITAGKFIKTFQTAHDYWNKQITRLEDLKTHTKTIFKVGKGGKKYPETVALEPMDILAIEKEQANLMERILFLASQGEVREVIKVMRVGKLPIPS